ncbi:MAG: TPM domain-containing protein [Proteobacteria bacterium]|nr:TPM domain-containing protein [Pseudomonadota bacterium]
MHTQVRTVFAALASLLIVGFITTGAALAATPTFPALTGRVVDEAGILSSDTKQQLDGMLAEHEKQTTNQVVVVTLKSLQGNTIEDYGYRLGRAWGIGQKGKNNGALVIVAPNEHAVRIEVGYGLEGELTDAQSRLIIENVILPQFKKGDYDKGVLDGTTILLKVLGGDASALPQESEQPQDDGRPGGFGIIIAMIVIWLLFGRFFWPLLFFGGMMGRGRYGGGFYGGGGFGGGFGGGGFSGGGGSFGGGGASGHW